MTGKPALAMRISAVVALVGVVIATSYFDPFAWFEKGLFIQFVIIIPATLLSLGVCLLFLRKQSNRIAILY